MTFDHAFHGRTLLAMSHGGQGDALQASAWGRSRPRSTGSAVRLPYRWLGDHDRVTEEALAYAIDEMHKHIGEENIAAVIMEPIQGERLHRAFARLREGVADFCAAHEIVFIADEIQSGMGRAGRWFAIEDEDVVPDR